MYYLEHSAGVGPNRYVVLATYDEGKAVTAPPGSAYAWYYPYGNAPIEVMDGDIEQFVRDVSFDGGYYRKVLLYPKWHIKHKLSILVPGPKQTIKCGGLPPYGTREVYWETVLKYPETSPIGEAVAALKYYWDNNPMFMEVQAYYAQLEVDGELGELESNYEAIRDRLAPMLTQGESRNGIRAAIAGALPAGLPPPGHSSLNYPHMQGDPSWGRLTWQWRMMYVLCMGIAQGAL